MAPAVQIIGDARDRAWSLYNKAAYAGDARAPSRLEFAYQSGLFDQAIDEEVALKWYRKAAEGADDDAQTRLDDAYNEGELTLAIDLQAALTWYQKTAEGGNRYA